LPEGGVAIRPPPLPHEDPASHRSGHVWIPGFWDWNGDHYSWVAGRWALGRTGCHWRRHQWVARDDRWYLQMGVWVRDETWPPDVTDVDSGETGTPQ